MAVSIRIQSIGSGIIKKDLSYSDVKNRYIKYRDLYLKLKSERHKNIEKGILNSNKHHGRLRKYNRKQIINDWINRRIGQSSKDIANADNVPLSTFYRITKGLHD